MRAFLLAAALLGLAASRARAGTNADVVPLPPADIPPAEPVVPLDDTRSYGPTARNFVDVSEATALLLDSHGAGVQLTTQFAIGVPTPSLRELRDVYNELHLTAYQFRVRDELFAGTESANGGPMTFAAQRYFALNPLAIDPLLFAHIGIEAAVATPWLSGRDVVPVHVVEVVDGPDRELTGDGWSVRPASAYFRGDFLACRSESLDIGLEPELFIPTSGPREYATRFHAAVGFSLACHGEVPPQMPKLVFEYRGRVRLYSGDEPVGYADNIAAGLQMNAGPVMVQLFYKADPGRFAHGAAVGIRVQVGARK